METDWKSITTKKLYQEDTYLFSAKAQLIQFQQDQKNQNLISLLLDQTIFHPQGGGQPNDEGIIKICKKSEEENNNQSEICLKVVNLIYNRETDQIWHQINSEELQKNQLDLKINQEVTLEIDQQKRRLHARLHSAGHFIDLGVYSLKLEVSPGKGCHFPDSPSVEYFVKNYDFSKINELQNYLSEYCNKQLSEIKEQDATFVKVYSYEEAQKAFEVPSYLTQGTNIRFVKLIAEDKGCPCGGTHVKHVKEIGEIVIQKVQKKGKNLRISYTVK